MEQHSIGKTIAKLRKEKDWTQLELAEKLNVSDKTISKWESETGLPEITQFPTLANIFEVSIDYLMTGKKEEKIKVISKLEEIIKKDDIESFSKISDETLSCIDADGKYLFDYLIKYNAPNIALDIEKRKIKFDYNKLTREQKVNDHLMHYYYGIFLQSNIEIGKDYYWVLDLILQRYKIMTQLAKEKFFSRCDLKIIEYALNNSKDKEDIIDLFIKTSPLFTKNNNNPKYYFSKETKDNALTFVLNKGYGNLVIKYCDLSTLNIDIIAKYKDKFPKEKLVPLCLYDNNTINLKILDLFNDYNLTKTVFDKYDILQKRDVFIYQNIAYNISDNENHHIFSGFISDYPYEIKWQTLPKDNSGIHYMLMLPENSDINNASTIVNKTYKNGFLADQFVHQNRKKLDRKLKMCYITDLYNRNLFEDCADLMGKKLYEFFTVVCDLKGSLEEMAEYYNTNFEPGYFTSNEYDDKKFGGKGYQVDSGKLYCYVKISDLINHIVDIYNKVIKNKFDEKIDKIYKTELQLLGKLYDEEVIFPVDHSNDWD